MTADEMENEIAGRPTTVTATGIAKMAGVGRAAVSNWRRRYSDFPQPVGGTTSSPAFDLTAVEGWLERQGRTPEASPGERAWLRIAAFSSAARITDALCIAGALLLTRSPLTGSAPEPALHADRGSGPAIPSPQRLLRLVRAHSPAVAAALADVVPEEWSRQHVELLQAADGLADEDYPGEAFEYLHAQYTLTRAAAGPDVTPEPIAGLMLDLAGTGARIFDFACGTGSLLYAATQRALAASTSIRCYGQDVSPAHARIALLRLWFAHSRAVNAGLTSDPPVIQPGDSLLADAFPELGADIVVANPPFGIHDWGHEQLAYDPRWTFGGLPPRTEPELAWVQHALAHLAPGGHAVLLMPPAAAARPAGRRIRSELVRRGALRAVVALPPGLMPSTAVGLHLWVLQRPLSAERTAAPVLFIDTATRIVGKTRPGSLTRSADAAAVRDTLVRAWRAYLADPHAVPQQPGVYRTIEPIQLLDDEIDLTPHRHLPANAGLDADPEHLLAARNALDTLIGALRSSLPQLRAAGNSPLANASTAELADLAHTGALTIHRPAPRAGQRDADITGGNQVPAVTGQDVASGGAPTGSVPQPPGEFAATQIQPGDVLIPVIAQDILARVATPEQVGTELGAGVHAVRVHPDVLDPWFLAGALSRTGNTRAAGRASATIAGTLRIDVKRLTVPVLPIDVQSIYGEAFRHIASFETALADVAEHGRAVVRDLVNGLINGILIPEADTSKPHDPPAS